MLRSIGLPAFVLLLGGAAQADVALVQVPAMCGSSAEILDGLAYKMPDPRVVGTGGDSQGEEIATLFSGNGYWALLAMVSPERVCVVASGHNWKAADTGVAEAY
jgi:hypothetical protein